METKLTYLEKLRLKKIEEEAPAEAEKECQRNAEAYKAWIAEEKYRAYLNNFQKIADGYYIYTGD